MMAELAASRAETAAAKAEATAIKSELQAAQRAAKEAMEDVSTLVRSRQVLISLRYHTVNDDMLCPNVSSGDAAH